MLTNAADWLAWAWSYITSEKGIETARAGRGYLLIYAQLPPRPFWRRKSETALLIALSVAERSSKRRSTRVQIRTSPIIWSSSKNAKAT